MPDVVQKNGGIYCLCLFIGDDLPFRPQHFNGFAHQEHGAHGMMKAGVESAGINKMRQSKLLDATQSLKKRMLNNFENKIVLHGNKPVNRIVENFTFV